MKRSLVVPALLLCLVAVAVEGCASFARKSSARNQRSRTYALAVTVGGVLQPTPAQFAAIQAKAVEEFGALGYVLVTDLSLAERILRVDFTPNPIDPENSGRATVLGFRTNPLYATARSTIASPYPTSFGFAGSFSNTNWAALNNFGYGYYGYGNSYYDGYSYSSPNLNPVTTVTTTKRVIPPFRHDSIHCPPDLHRIKPPVPFFAADYRSDLRSDNSRSSERQSARGTNGDNSGANSNAAWRGGDRYNSTSSTRSERTDRTERASGDRTSGDRGNRGSERTYTRSEPTHSRSESTYSRSEHSYSPPSSGSSSSSSSSYSAPTYSSSSGSSSSSSSAGSSSSGSGYSGPRESAPNRQQN